MARKKQSPPKPDQKSVGLSGGVRKPSTQAPGKLKVSARAAGDASKRFSRGGAGFAAWVLSQGAARDERRSLADWEKLIEEFAARPIHGHRRGRGDNHKMNR